MPNPDINSEVQARQTALLYRNAGLAQGINITVSALLAYIGYVSRPGPIIVVWWLLMLVTSIARYQLVRRYGTVHLALAEREKWNTRYVHSIAWTSLLWLLGGSLIIWGNSDSYRFLTSLVLAGMVAGAVPVLSPVNDAFRVYAISILGGVALLTFVKATSPVDWVFGAMALIFLVGALVSSNHLHDVLVESITLKALAESQHQAIARYLDMEKARNREMALALSQAEYTKGALPVCAWCRKVREEDGSWSSLDAHFEKKHGVVITHGICPECRPALTEDYSKEGTT